jgi:hypothetical protein
MNGEVEFDLEGSCSCGRLVKNAGTQAAFIVVAQAEETIKAKSIPTFERLWYKPKLAPSGTGRELHAD